MQDTDRGAVHRAAQTVWKTRLGDDVEIPSLDADFIVSDEYGGVLIKAYLWISHEAIEAETLKKDEA